jgi:hypothetical protein
MQSFSTIVGQYNSTLLSLADKQHSILALDAKSRLITDHTTSSIKVGDGTDLVRVLTHDAAASVPIGETGFGILAVRNDDEGTLVSHDKDFTFLQVDNLGRLRVSSTAPGAQGDTCAAASGIGEIPAVGLAAWVDVVTIPVPVGQLYQMEAFDVSADKLCQFRVVEWDSSQLPGAEVVKYIRKILLTENLGTIQIVFPRTVQVTGGATISLRVQAIRLRGGSVDANVSGGVNGYWT